MQKCIGMSLSPRLPAWDDVRVFLAVYRAGSLSAAAKPLGVTQPTCGRRLAALEESLGVRLFDRTPDGLRITAEGESLLEAATAMELNAHEVALRASMGNVALDGTVRIATSEAFACSFLVDALATMRQRYPGIRAELVISNEQTDLLKREADIAVRFGPEGFQPAQQSLTARRLGEEPFRLYATEGYVRRQGAPDNPAALRGHDVVVFSGGHPAAQWCARAYRGANAVMSAPSMQVVATAVSAGLGLGVLPERTARKWPALQPQSPVIARASGWLLIHPQLRRVPRIKAVVELWVALFHG